MSEEKVVVKVKSEAERKLVIETPEGKEQTYYLNPIRTMYLHVQKLQISKGLHLYHFGDAELGPQPELSLYVLGTATLEGRSISVIGDPGNKTRTLSLSFKAPNEEGKQSEDAAQKQGKTPRYTSATVGLNRHDWEIGNDDDWFAECEVSPDTLIAISSAVSSGRLRGMTVGLTLEGIYSDDDWAPPSVKTDWFLRPNRSDDTIDFPELARGDITRLWLDLASVDLRPQSEEANPEPEALDDPAPAPMAAQMDHHTTVLYVLAGNVEKLRGTLKWVGGLIAFFLLVLAFK